jgi:hypothetical protein
VHSFVLQVPLGDVLEKFVSFPEVHGRLTQPVVLDQDTT